MTVLHEIGGFVRELFLAIPLSVVRVLFVAVPVLLLLWVIRLPRERTISPDGEGLWSENLKYGAAAALLVQIVIYGIL